METENSTILILFIDDELNWLSFAEKVGTEMGYLILKNQSLKDSWELVQNKRCDLILVDEKKMENELEFFQKLVKLQRERNQLIIVMLPIEMTPQNVINILKMGVHDCVNKAYEEYKLKTLLKEQLSKKITSNPEKRIRSTAGKKNILIVEDDGDWRFKLKDYLNDQPFSIKTARDLETAIRLLQKKIYDVIILDLRLNDNGDEFEGMKFLELIRKNDPLVPIVIVSAYGTVQHVREGYNNYKIFDYIPKQYFDRHSYRRSIENAINQHRKGEVSLDKRR